MSYEFRAEVGFETVTRAGQPFVRWTDITPWVSDVSTSAGRSFELDRIEAGEATIILDNADGRFTPGRSVVAPVTEYFNHIGEIGSDGSVSTFTGLWRHVNSGGPAITLLAPGGIRLESTEPDATYVELQQDIGNRLVPVTEGQSVTVAFKARVESASNLTALTPRVRFAASGVDVSSVDGSPVRSDGDVVTVRESVTVPAGVTHVRPAVVATHAAGGSGGLALTVYWVKVELLAPYTPNVKPRKKVRLYTIFDGNHVHWDAVNASQADMSAPRMWIETSTDEVTQDGISSAFDATKGMEVFTVQPNPGNDLIRIGPKGGRDWIQVEQGQTVTIDVDMCGASGEFVGAMLAGWDGSVQFADGDERIASGNWEHYSHTYHFEEPGGGWVSVYLYAPRIGELRFANLKVRVGASASATVAEPSGVAPIFYGHAEQWITEYEDTIPFTRLECVDGMALLDGPVPTAYRAAVVQAVEGIDRVYYWPCADAAESAFAEPYIGDLRLRAVSSTPAPDAWGFAAEAVMPHGDGQSRSFGSNHTDTTRGATLRLAHYNAPYLPSDESLTVAFWYVPDARPSGAMHCLFAIWNAAGQELWAVYYDSAGAIRCERWDRDLGTSSSLTVPLDAQPGEPIFIVLSKEVRDDGIFYYMALNDDPEPTVVANTSLPDPGFAFVAFGGNLTPFSSSQFMQGRIGHILWAYGLISDADRLAMYSVGVDVAESETDRINRILSIANWTGQTILDPPKSLLLSARWNEDAQASDLVKAAAESASGVAFVGPGGELVYQNRERRITAPTRWTLAESSPGLRFVDDDARIYNIIRAQRVTGLERVARDEASIAEYGPKQLIVTRDVESPDEVADAAAWLLQRYRDAAPYIDTVTVDGSADNTGDLTGLTWRAGIGDRLDLVDLPSTAPADGMSTFIEGVARRIRPVGERLEVTASFRVSTAQASLAWILEDPVSGVLDTDACALSY